MIQYLYTLMIGMEETMYEKLREDISVEAARAGGPGGQHVNKTNSKAIARLDVLGSSVLSDEDKATLNRKLKLTVEGDLVVHVSRERSWQDNRKIATRRLLEKVETALTPETPRGQTRVPKREKRRRLDDKKRRSTLKQQRQSPKGEY